MFRTLRLKYPVADIVVFMDFLSLTQPPWKLGQAERTHEEQRHFSQAIMHMHFCYCYSDAILHVHINAPPEDMEVHVEVRGSPYQNVFLRVLRAGRGSLKIFHLPSSGPPQERKCSWWVRHALDTKFRQFSYCVFGPNSVAWLTCELMLKANLIEYFPCSMKKCSDSKGIHAVFLSS